MDYTSLLISLIGLFLALYYPTRKRRLNKKIRKLEEKISKVEKYSKTTGYKSILVDCFQLFSYAIGASLIIYGLQNLLLPIITQPYIKLFINSLSNGIYMGSGFILINIFIDLVVIEEPRKTINKLQKKIESLEKEKDNI